MKRAPVHSILAIAAALVLLVRAPKAQSDELHMALKKLGVPGEYIVYPRMPHGITDPRYQLVKMVSEYRWFEKWIRGKEGWFEWKEVLATLDEPREERTRQSAGGNDTDH